MIDDIAKKGSTCFVDTNIWLYAFIKTQDPEKTVIAQSVLEISEIVISTQIINEMCVNLIKKVIFSEKDIERLIRSLYKRNTVYELSEDVLIKASQIRQKYTFSYWDSIVAASALDCDAEYLISEDMQNQFVLENKLTIINPFVSKNKI